MTAWHLVIFQRYPVIAVWACIPVFLGLYSSSKSLKIESDLEKKPQHTLDFHHHWREHAGKQNYAMG